MNRKETNKRSEADASLRDTVGKFPEKLNGVQFETDLALNDLTQRDVFRTELFQ